jgi:putative endonuclease
VKTYQQKFGRWGENIASDFLLKKGFKIIDRNWTCRLGEIDIIALKQCRVHFVEVKTRRDLEETLTPSKMRSLLMTGHMYLKKNGLSFDHYQFDFIGINAGGEDRQLIHLENVVEDNW